MALKNKLLKEKDKRITVIRDGEVEVVYHIEGIYSYKDTRKQIDAKKQHSIDLKIQQYEREGFNATYENGIITVY